MGAEATVEVVGPPTGPDLYFWAMQVDFHDGRQGTGGAHIGPQWISIHPGSRAVNWGGYAAAGGELDGSRSALPSAPGNVNTRDYSWVANRAYRLRVSWAGVAPKAGCSSWRGEIVDLASGEVTVVRDLYAPGDRIHGAMVWSEVFAPCDAPTTAVRWSDLAMVDADGGRAAVTEATVNYQSRADGGCATTNTSVDGGAFLQRTGTVRTTPQGTVLRLPHP